MADPELEEIRKQRLAQMQSQYQVSFVNNSICINYFNLCHFF